MTDGAGQTGSGRGPDVIVNAVTEEVLTVGSVTGNDWDTFGRVGSVHFNAQGNLHIFDGQADHIVVVGQDGSLIRTVGGQGEGPGEFDNVTAAIVGRDGSYTVMGFRRPSGRHVHATGRRQGAAGVRQGWSPGRAGPGSDQLAQYHSE